MAPQKLLILNLKAARPNTFKLAMGQITTCNVIWTRIIPQLCNSPLLYGAL